ncbi:exocyst complex subunit Sec15 [Trichosporon asahii var. asahii CBS 2479]|uniref:Exocyst complex component SEC15 n=1 Tax=Trichosporon asahii var. asahii (strain ATCC 90039 / CBS 2479 / JCM 2466 / KCTC 7840 / NBRC 103889/ NCYC 2677 / UAMH 7654) TaxID=1186058 RepID=J8TSD0_TRIAS|nr:exocyst complex subunit Sec15 [Trichosporon asahii var. asahii CBS 2479]EJT53129.1 exocyst complex subunit Sec15 [Trichosporon asahii var. asahii CBS 2479]
MNRKQRPTFSSAELELQLQQITLDPTSATTENFEALTPLIKTIQESESEQLYLNSLDRFVEEKEREIEQICETNYEDFVSSVLTLSTVRQGTSHLRKRIGELDGQMGDVGRALGEKKKVARNMDDAIETLQTCLRLLDLVHRVGELTREGKYWGALRSWLFDIRESSALVGKLALKHMDSRIKRWRARREKDGNIRLANIGGALELVNNERTEFNALDNEQIKIDFRPLYQCIHIYEALDAKSELQRNYQEDRKANLILSSRAATTPETLKANLPYLIQELVGFFIIEAHVLRSAPDFRSRRDVDDLWDEMCRRIMDVVGQGLKGCSELEIFLESKRNILLFVQTLQGHGYDVTELNGLLITLFERYSELLVRKFSADFNHIVSDDDNMPMMVNTTQEFEQVAGVCWFAAGEVEQLAIFVEQFYQFADGVAQHHVDIDEVLRKSLDDLLTDNVSKQIARRLKGMSNLSQLAQVVINLEHFATACDELESVLMNLRYIASKLDSFFDLAEYTWLPRTPPAAQHEPSTYVFEMITFLTANVDSVLFGLNESVKTHVYGNALALINKWFMVPRYNEAALAYVFNDVTYIQTEIGRLDRPGLDHVFDEVKLSIKLILDEAVNAYMEPSVRELSYRAVKSQRLATMLGKLSAGAAAMGNTSKAERRRAEAETVSRFR